MTLAGHPPSSWRSVQLGSLVTTFGGLSGKSKADFGTGNATYVPFTAVVGQTRLSGDHLERVAVGRDEKQHQVERGDVLLNGSSETPDELALASVVAFQPDPQTYLNSFCFGLRRITDAPVSPLFLAYFFRSPVGRALVAPLAQGSTRYNIAKTKLLKLELPMPALEEQKTIAQVLADVDDLCDSIDRAITKKRDVRAGLAQQLLTGLTRLAGFDSGWSKTKLGDLGMFVKGRGVRRSDVQGSGVPCIRYGEIYTTFGDYTAHTVSFVTPATAETALPLETGDLLFAGSGETRDEIGMCVAYTGDHVAVAGGDIVVLRGHGQNPVFMAALMNSPEIVRQKSRAGQGDAVVHIYASALAEIEFSLPSREEQDAIAEVIQSADLEIAALEHRHKKTLQIRQGMMQALLTGRTRLPTGDAQEAAA